MNETEKMLTGKIYDITDPELLRLRAQGHRYSQMYNQTFEDETEKREEILSVILPDRDKSFYLQGPIQFDYGVFTKMGKNGFANFNFTVLDCCPVTIGDNVFIGCNVSLMTPIHPMIPSERNIRFKEDGTAYDYEYAAPITIEDNCWIASNVVVCGGVTIHSGSVIGAGSVVTRDIPSGVFAAGNPCRVIRKITEQDSIYLKKELF
jgi:maltose O-acetyltransferase